MPAFYYYVIMKIFVCVTSIVTLVQLYNTWSVWLECMLRIGPAVFCDCMLVSDRIVMLTLSCNSVMCLVWCHMTPVCVLFVKSFMP